jgi:hypothetical protein
LTIQLRLPERTYDMLKLFICESEKCQFKKGMIMEYVNRAVLEMISSGKGHSTHTQFVKHDETRQLKERIIKWLFGEPYRYTDLKKVNEFHVKQAIRTIEGVRDSRTVKNRIEALLTCGVRKIVNYDKPPQYDFEPEIWQEALK